jgi:hypothetical protein
MDKVMFGNEGGGKKHKGHRPTMGSIVSKRSTVYAAMIIACLLVFETFNIDGNRKGLVILIGMPAWANLLAWALAAIDFAGLAKLAVPQFRELPQMAVWTLAIAWGMSAVFDTFLTYVVIATNMIANATTNTLVVGGIVTANFYANGIPTIIAVVLCLLQIFLVWRMESTSGAFIEE